MCVHEHPCTHTRTRVGTHPVLLVDLGLSVLVERETIHLLLWFGHPPYLLYLHFKIVWLTKNNSMENKL